MTKFIKYFAFTIFSTFIILGCKKDSISTNTALNISLSTDTLFYDTLFTTIGSVTKTLKVYNPNSSDIKISSIKLGNGNASNFAINVNGKNSNSVSNMLVRANDSIFIFVKVTINPATPNIPFIVRDSLEFVANTNKQHVKLLAWGQNAYFHKPVAGNSQIVIDTNTVLPNDKPHVFMANTIVKENVQLTLQKGTRLHFNNNTGLFFDPKSTLNINGILGEEVQFLGIRLDSDVENLPGQWNGITFTNNNLNASLNYAIIKNTTTALKFENENNLVNNPISISNCIIENNSSYAINAQNSSITGSNLLITNCGLSMLNLINNGNHSFTHCTFGNYWDQSSRNDAIINIPNSAKSRFTNCIIFGDNQEELNINQNSDFKFINCVLKTKQSITDSAKYFHCTTLDAGFKNVFLNDYTLSSGSPAKNPGDTAAVILIPLDLKGIARDTMPDLGTFEFVRDSL